MNETRSVSPSCAEAVRCVIDTAQRAGVRLPPAAESLLTRYCGEIVVVSAHTNVTAARTPDRIATSLFLESLALLPVLDQHLSDSAAVVDVGTGAGIPGIPLAIARPGWKLTLLESIGKKAAFVRAAAEAVGLRNVSVIAERAESVAATPKAPVWDLAVARAVAALPALLELCAPLVRTDGIIVFPKSGDVAAEIAAAAEAQRVMRLELLASHTVPEEFGLGNDRVTLVYRKVGATPPGFPRRTGLATSRPLASKR